MNYNFRKKLSVLEKIYLLLHQKIFDYRLSQQSYFEDKIIISIGNLSLGGTGKTPLAIFLADYFLKKGNQVLICLRGYKGNFKDELLVCENGKILTTPYMSGDEAYLVSYKLLEKNHKNFKVVCGKNKKNLIQRFGINCNLVIFDDAFQNPSIYKNLEITLLDTTDDPKNIKLLPIGKYREPIEALHRSDIILLTRTNENPENVVSWKAILNNFSIQYFLSIPKMISIKPKLEKKEIIAVCGIGNPNSFLYLLEKQGLKIVAKFIYRDHYSFTNLDIQKWLQYKLPILLTEKDWVRILYNPLFLQNKSYFHRLEIEIEIMNSKAFLKAIEKFINKINKI
ncbi:MAG: tetraacyldisaccharide 4'-kinase [Leptonema sp. (in: bacteria)]